MTEKLSNIFNSYMMKKLALWSLLLLLITSCTSKSVFVSFDNSELTYEGRILYEDSVAWMIWSGTSVTMNFTGSVVSAVLQDEDTSNYYNVIVDGEVVNKIHTSPQKNTYVLADNLGQGEHNVQLFKRTQWDKGKTRFYGFVFEEGGQVLPQSPAKTRKIEFYGNSITCGHGIEDFEDDRGSGKYENNYETYAAITARYFDAQYHCISKSGIGVLVSWFPLIMPEMYNRTVPTDPNSVWDFSQYTPDVVVINLYQNDSWIVNLPEHKEFKHRFGTEAPDAETIIAAYNDFVSIIRFEYPEASIICALGSMDATREGSPWPDYIKEAVNRLNDDKAYVCFFPFKNTPGHPEVNEHRVMADKLIKFIEENIEW